MRFSVIVPIYKTEKYIHQCVDSILEQSCGDLEVILVDDGSPDGCPQIVDEYALNDDRVVPVHKKNGGLVSARKAGAAVARGDYIVNVDSDDYIHADLLAQLSEIIDKETPDAIFFGYTLFNDFNSETKTGISKLSPGVYREHDVKNVVSRYLYDKESGGMNGGIVAFNICCKSVRREIYAECQNSVPDSIVSGEDTAFTMNLLRKVNSIVATENYGYWYRQNPQSIEHTVSTRDLTNLETVLEELVRISNGEAEYANQINVYGISRLWVLSIRSAIGAKTYKEFVSYVKDTRYDKILSRVKTAEVYQKRKVEHFVLAAVKNKWFLLIYLLGKTWFKNKDMM